MAGRYRYLFCDLLTDRPITELDLAEAGFERRIGRPGRFRAVLHPREAETVRRVRAAFPPAHGGPAAAGPGRVVCHVYRDGELWGSYIVWSSVSSADGSDGPRLALYGASLESYLYRRVIRRELRFDDVDQIAIAHDLIGAMQEVPHEDIGLVPAGRLSGVHRTRTYSPERTVTYGECLAELAAAPDGFEYRISTYGNETRRHREFVTGHPRLGALDAPARTEFTSGNVLAWSYRDSAAAGSTRSGTGRDTFEARSHLLAGWPALDRASAHEGPCVANARALKLVAPLDEHPSLHPDRLGERVRVQLEETWWDPGPRWRIVGMTITAHTGRVLLTLEEDQIGTV
ncbi:hypothetical protein ABGB12_30330 [Actinocorallia sp. B10E7]|uniref:hypothetical protein n=1 Tax=Actinocorallia sp. B10E7 TaxID=3153558 RepID=UPI00325E22B7